MSQLETRVNDASVEAFLAAVADETRREDARRLLTLFVEESGEPPRMWGSSIVGFGSYHYRYASGREGDWMLTGFSPRKQNLTLYIMMGFDALTPLLDTLGPHKLGKSCLYIKRLADIDEQILRLIIRQGLTAMRDHYPRDAGQPDSR